jgi:hypothetical protein
MFLANKLNKSAGAPAPKDAQFNYVTMLLHGDGTNGAQNNTFLDSSTNNFTITRNGNTTQGSFSPYGPNWSNYSSGSGYLLVADNAALSVGAGDFTIEAWLNPASLPSSGNFKVIWSKRTSGATTGGATLAIDSSGNYLFFVASGTGTWGISGVSSGQTASLNSWQHLAMVRNGNNLILYKNGVAGTTVTLNFTVVDADAMSIMAGSAAGGQVTDGYISNLRLVKGTAVYTSNFTPSTTPLTAITNTSLLTCQSNRFIDNSASPLTITANGTPSVQRFNPFGASTAYSTSVIGGSGYFDGSGDYLTIPSTSAFNFGSNNFTVEFWWNTTKSGQNIINPTGTGNGWAILLSGGNLGWNDSYNVTALFTVNATSILDNAWHHVAFVRSSGTTYVYFDGVLKATNADPTVYSLGATDWFIGNGNVADFQGYMCDMRINNGTAVYTSAFTPPTAPLTAITNTKLLLNYTNGAIFDNAMMNDLETVGNAQISTSVKKYGTGSMSFDGTGDYLLSTGTQNATFGTGDFTIEMWLYSNTTSPTFQGVMDSRPSGGASANAFLIYMASGGTLYYFSNSSNIVSYSSISTNTWTHVAITRSSSSLRLFINGTISGSAVSNTTNLTETQIIVGNTYDNFYLNGYIDDLRITKGYARYTANFTAPTAALPDIGPN